MQIAELNSKLADENLSVLLIELVYINRIVNSQSIL